MDCMSDVVRKELKRGCIGSNTKCKYHPCHHEGQDCTFCYCPFYPCNDPEVGGEEIVSPKRGTPVWSCMNCHFIHTRPVAEYVFEKLKDSDFPDGVDLKGLFADVKSRFLDSCEEFPKRPHKKYDE